MTSFSPGTRVLMTADAVGGVWNYATALARGLGERGHSVHLIVLGPEPTPGQREALRDAPGVTLETAGLALEWMDPAGEDVPRARAYLADAERRVRPDLVHLNGFREAAYHWDAPVLVAAHSDVWSWWRACRGGDPDEMRWRTYIANVRNGLKAADEWVAPSAAYGAEVRELFGPPRPGRVIHNGTASGESGRAARKEGFVLAAGRFWDEAKNIAALVAASSLQSWPIVIAGERTSTAEGMVPSAATEPRGVEFTGALPHGDLLGHMGRAEIFVSPALYEPFGLAVLEAAAAGCALVLADIPTFRELWEGAALFVDPRDPARLRAGLHRLQEDVQLRRDLQEQAAARAGRYSLEVMADRYAALYARMIRECAAAGDPVRRPALLEAAAS